MQPPKSIHGDRSSFKKDGSMRMGRSVSSSTQATIIRTTERRLSYSKVTKEDNEQDNERIRLLKSRHFAEVPSPRRVSTHKTTADVFVPEYDDDQGYRYPVIRHLNWLRNNSLTNELTLRTLIRGLSPSETEDLILHLDRECITLEKLVTLMVESGTNSGYLLNGIGGSSGRTPRTASLRILDIEPNSNQTMKKSSSFTQKREVKSPTSRQIIQPGISIDLSSTLNQARNALPVQRIRVLQVDEELDATWNLLTQSLVFDNCLAKHCVFLGKPHLLNQIGYSQPFINDHLEKNIKSIISVPIEMNQPRRKCHTVVQFINRLEFPQSSALSSHGFSREDEVTAVRISQHIRHISRLLRHEEKMAENKVQMEQFSQVALAVCSQQDSKSLIEDNLRLLQKVTNSERVMLYLCDHARKNLYCIYSSVPSQQGRLESYNDSIAGWVAEHPEPINLRDVYRDPRFEPTWDLNRESTPTRSVLGIPIFSKSVIFGVLQLVNKIATTKAERRLPALSAQLSLAFNKKNHGANNNDANVRSARLRLHRVHTVTRMGHTRSASAAAAVPDNEPFDETETPVNSPISPSSALKPDVPQIQCHHCMGQLPCRKCVKRKEAEEKENHRRSTSVTFYTEFDLKVCNLVCARITQSMSTRAVNFQYDKAIAESSDSSGVLRSLLQDQTNMNEEDTVAELLTAEAEDYKVAFKAIGKFMRVIQSKRDSNGSSYRGRSRRWSLSSVGGALNVVLDETFRDLLHSQALPSRELLCSLNSRHAKICGESDESTFGNWHVDILGYQNKELVEEITSAIYRLGLCQKFNLDQSKVHPFVEAIRRRYLDNPYHNWFHGAHVFQQAYAFLLNTSAADGLHYHDILALMIASLCHDVGHTGRTNDFECKSLSPLSLRYNDTSVLENYHAALTFEVLFSEGTNILSAVAPPKVKEIRRIIITLILATDMKNHASVVTAMNSLILDDETIQTVRNQGPMRQTLTTFILHACDIGAQTAPVPIAMKWAELVLKEFREQNEDEVKQNLPLTPHMQNLDDPSVEARVQIGFIDYIVEPTWKLMASFFPEMHSSLLENIAANRAAYEEKLENSKQS